MNPTLFEIVWLIGAMAASLCLGLVFLQFVVWLLVGLPKEEQDRPLFYRHRQPQYPDAIILHPEIDVRKTKEVRHDQMRKVFGWLSPGALQRRAEQRVEEILKTYEQKVER
jgi:hypothetical protein